MVSHIIDMQSNIKKLTATALGMMSLFTADTTKEIKSKNVMSENLGRE